MVRSVALIITKGLPNAFQKELNRNNNNKFRKGKIVFLNHFFVEKIFSTNTNFRALEKTFTKNLGKDQTKKFLFELEGEKFL